MSITKFVVSTSGKRGARLVASTFVAVGLLGAAGVAGPAAAQVAPPTPTSCYTQLKGSGSSTKVTFSSYVYQCKNAASMYEVFDVLQGSKVVKQTEISCPVNHLSACLGTAFTFSKSKPTGSKNWQFQATIEWYPLVTDGTVIAKYSDALNVTS